MAEDKEQLQSQQDRARWEQWGSESHNLPQRQDTRLAQAVMEVFRKQPCNDSSPPDVISTLVVSCITIVITIVILQANWPHQSGRRFISRVIIPQQ